MASLLYVITHSTDDPDRAVTALAAAVAAARAEHQVALWLTGEGVRVGIRGVAETLAEPGEESAAQMRDALIAAGAPFYLDRLSFERRGFEHDALCEGAQVVGADHLPTVLSTYRDAVTL